MHFRTSRQDDFDRIMDILASGRAALGALGIDQWQGGYPRGEVVAADIARGDSYVVDDEGQLIATAMISFAGEGDYDHIEGAWLTSCRSDNPSYGVVHRVAVDSAYTGHGAASFLLACAQKLVRKHGGKSLRIDTHPGNTPMRNLLTKQGFTECGIIYISHAEEGTPERIAYEKLV